MVAGESSMPKRGREPAPLLFTRKDQREASVEYILVPTSLDRSQRQDMLGTVCLWSGVEGIIRSYVGGCWSESRFWYTGGTKRTPSCFYCGELFSYRCYAYSFDRSTYER
ncbi:hypothetical protein NE237_005206 [Protea cynaroides]|uniref:Uncharacterized protein n=1 Tax=Protea cynaroides TaxID=273540 RepID=A0A9Q0KKB7_9MAGN|nr:hypothetical protein NE237_005206 [Protea cynaroides]